MVDDTENRDKASWNPNLLYKDPGLCPKPKHICVIESSIDHFTFLRRGLDKINERLGGSPNPDKPAKLNTFLFLANLNSASFVEEAWKFVKYRLHKPDMVIISFLWKQHHHKVQELLGRLWEWTEEKSVVLMCDQRVEKGFTEPIFSRYDPEAITYIENWLTKDEQIM